MWDCMSLVLFQIIAWLHVNSTLTEITVTTSSYRDLKSMDIYEFRDQFMNLDPATTVDDFTDQLHSSVTGILDLMAPVRTKRLKGQAKLTPWLSDEAKKSKRHRRRLERIWTQTRTDADRLAYRRACRTTNSVIELRKIRSVLLTSAAQTFWVGSRTMGLVWTPQRPKFYFSERDRPWVRLILIRRLISLDVASSQRTVWKALASFSTTRCRLTHTLIWFVKYVTFTFEHCATSGILYHLIWPRR